MTISFDSDRHEAFIDSLRAATHVIEEELDTLDERVLILRPAWSGEARDAYDDAQNAWSTCMRALHGVLSDASTAASSAGESLRQAEHAVRSLWS